MGILLTRSRWAELAFSPYAVILQVMPLVAVAPMLVIYAGVTATVYLSVFLVAFFPVLAGTIVGLRSAESGLADLFALYRASPVQRLALLVPSALPFILAGVRTAGGLSLIGAVVAEFVAGTGGADAGLAYRIVEASYRLNVPRLFAAVTLICIAGVLHLSRREPGLPPAAAALAPQRADAQLALRKPLGGRAVSHRANAGVPRRVGVAQALAAWFRCPGLRA